jgi:hypothetical protein
MLNPIPKPKPPTKTEQVKTVIGKTTKTISRERELVIAMLFLAVGFFMGRF